MSLLASDGHTVAEGLTTDDGTRTLSASRAGVYRVRVRRIGYVPYVSRAVALPDSGTIRISLELPPERVSLAAVHIRSSFKACGGGFSADRATSVAWDEIRTALRAAVLTERDSLVRLDVHRFTTFERPSGEPYEANMENIGQSGAEPFGTAKPDVLSRSGYVVHQVGGSTYWAPDAHVLLSPEFEHDHCFRIVARRDSLGGRIGLAFAPTADRSLPDIRGILWVDRESNRLQRLEYTYTNTNVPLGASKLGGELDFTSLPNGVWYIDRWVLRLPLVASNPVAPSRPRFAGYKVVGGIAAPNGATAVLPLNLRPARPATVVGALVTVHVIEEETDSAIDGAVVELQGGAAARLSDSTGSARFPAIAQGATRIRVRQIGFAPIDTTLVIRGDSVNISVALKPIATRLTTVRITATQARGFMAAFERRRSMGIGRFLTQSTFEREAWRSLNQVLVTHLGGLKLVPIATAQRDQLDNPVDLEQFGAMRLEAAQPSGILRDTKPTCPVDTYLDGVLFREDVDAIPTDIVGGVELYDKASAPPEYRRPGKACKVLLIWTRAK